MEKLKEAISTAAFDARLNLTGKDEKKLQRQICEVLQQVKVAKNDLGNIEEDPMFFPHDLKNAIREDKPEESMAREIALSNGPETDTSCFQVPRIVEE